MGGVEILIKAKDLTAAAFATTKAKLVALKAKVATTQGGFGSLGGKIMSVMSAAIAPIMLVVAAVYAIGKAVGSVTGQFGEFESAMKGVQKTTGMSDKEVAALGDDFKNLSKTVPKSAAELAGIGKVAGQLGIEGSENIMSFTETVAEASVAFDMDAEAAAHGLAALVKIYGKTIPEATNLGSAVNELGNTTGASEEQILNFATSLGPSAEMLGFTAGEALGMGATLIELKMDASAAGTQMNSAFTIMGQRIPEVSKLLNISENDFKTAFGEDAMGMLVRIIEKIKEIKDPLDQNTTATKIFGRIGAKSIRGLTKDTDRLTENVEKATDAYDKGTAMHEEYLVFASSYESKLELIKNKANLAAVAVGEKLAPAILALGNALTDTVIPGLGDLAIEIGKQTEDTWPNFKDAVTDAFAKLVGDTNLLTWSTIMTGIGTVIGTAISGILTGLQFIIEANGPFLVAIGGMVTCITEFVSDIQNLSVSEAFENLGKNIFTALGNVKDEISGKISPIVDAISSGLEKVKGKVAPIFEEVKTTIFTKLGSIKDGIGGILDPVKTAIHDKFAAIKDGLAGKLEPLTTIVLNALSGIKDKLGPIIDPIKTAIHDKLGGIKDGLEEKLAPVKTTIEGVFADAVSSIETSFGYLGESFASLWDSFTIPTEDIGEDIGEELGEVTGHIGIVGTAIEMMKAEWETVSAAVETVAEATDTMQTEAKEDIDKLTIDVDGVKVTFDGLKGKVTDVVAEFLTFEKIAGALIGLDWSVFTTLKEELPGIDKGIGDMKTAFEGLKTVLEDNMDNLESIQTDLGDIESTITPFVNNIAPGITAISNFGTALSDTQSALSTFASMSEIDIEGMLGFEGAVHSMVMGLEILDGQIERLIPSFSDIKTVIRSITDTFVYSGGKGNEFAESFAADVRAIDDLFVDLGGSSGEYAEKFVKNLEKGDDAVHASHFALEDMGTTWYHTHGKITESFEELTGRGLDYAEVVEVLTMEEEERVKWMDEQLRTSGALTHQLDKQTGALKSHTSELTKISDAIQPLINFMGTLNELYESVFGEKAAVWDALKVQEVFTAIEDTIRLMGEELGRVDFGEFIGEALDNSEDFRTAMVEDGSQLAVLTSYIDILLGNYVDLAELMGRLTEAEADMGDETFEVSQAFASLSDYIQGLATYLPALTSELGTLNDLWGEGGDTIEESMTSYHKLMSVVKAISLSFADFTGTMMELSMAQETATALGVDLGRSFEMVVEFVTELSNIIPSLATELDTLNGVWGKNQETVNEGATAFRDAMKPIETISDGMLDLGNVMATAGDDIGAKFDSITDYIAKLTAFTPQLALALSGLKTVWDENSGAINEGVSAFSNIQGAISAVQTSIGDLVSAEGALQTAADSATGAVNEEADALAGHSLSTSLDTTAASSVVLQGATTALQGAMGPLTGAVHVAAAALSGELVGALGAATSAMASLAGSAYSSGRSIAYSFADGIYSGMSAVEGAASALGAVVASYLSVHSNTELGALSDLMEWGPNVVKTFKKGIQGEMVSLSKTLNDMSLGGITMGSATSSGGGNISKKVYVTINQNISSRADAEYSVREIERLMKKPALI